MPSSAWKKTYPYCSPRSAIAFFTSSTSTFGLVSALPGAATAASAVASEFCPIASSSPTPVFSPVSDGYRYPRSFPTRRSSDLPSGCASRAATGSSPSWGPAPSGSSVPPRTKGPRSEEHTSELQSLTNLVCRLLLGKKHTPTALLAPPSLSSPAPHRPLDLYPHCQAQRRLHQQLLQSSALSPHPLPHPFFLLSPTATAILALSLHDALPISHRVARQGPLPDRHRAGGRRLRDRLCRRGRRR